MKISNTVINYNKLTSVIALIVFLALTIILYFNIENNNHEIAAREFDYRAQEIKTAIEHRMNEYRQVLRSGAGLFEASDTVSREDWKRFVETLNINESYPGIQGVGFTKRVQPKDLNRHIASVRKEGFPDYKIWPEGKRDEYTSIIYLEPFSGRNLRAFGYDMFSEPVRHRAMREARDNGRTAVSGKVILVQETGKGVQSGFLMYMPLFKRNMPVNTLEERRNALLGYVYSPFRMNDLLKGILGKDLPDVHLQIYDGKKIEEFRVGNKVIELEPQKIA
jgi:CHASE1-domain containing sensor protein